MERVQVQRSLCATVQLIRRTNSFSVKTVTLPFLVLLPTRCFCSSLFSLSVSPEKATRRRRPIKVNSLAKASMRENFAVRRTRKPPGTTSVSRQREANPFFVKESVPFPLPFSLSLSLWARRRLNPVFWTLKRSRAAIYSPAVHAFRPAADRYGATWLRTPTCLSSEVALWPKFSLFEYRRFKLVSCNYARICLKGSFAYFASAENGPAAITGSRLTYR